MADRDEIGRLWETLELLRKRTHDLRARVRALEWRIVLLERERTFWVKLPGRLAAIVITAAAVYTALRVLFPRHTP